MDESLIIEPFLAITYANIQGLYPNQNQCKVPYLQTMAKETPTIIALTETHLTPMILDSEIKIEGYTSFRKDREGRPKGGVIIYLPDDIPGDKILEFSNGVCDLIIISATISNKPLILANIYIPPDSSPLEMKEALEKITTCPEISENSREIIIMGDFNLPYCTWNRYGNMEAGKNNAKGRLLHDLMNRLLLTQLIQTPTRQRNILDLILTNNPKRLQDPLISPTQHSDHNIINIATDIPLMNLPNAQGQMMPFSDINLHKTDWTTVNSMLSNVDWHNELNDKSPEECWNIINHHLKRALYENSPKKTPVNRRKHRTKEHCYRRLLMRRRTKIVKKLSTITHTGTNTSRETEDRAKKEIIEIERKIKDSHEKENKELEKKAVTLVKKNPKFFFNYAKKKATLNNRIGPLVTADRQSTTSIPEEMANILQNQYIKAWSTPIPSNEILTIAQGVANQEQNLADIPITQEDIEITIKEMNANASPGPDGIGMKILKECKSTLSVPLMILWRNSLDTQEIPPVFKQANITPIYKGGPRKEPKNYRPIALTSNVIKLFEKILKKHIVKYLEENHLISEFQHGFRNKRSCLTELIDFHNSVLKSLGENHDVDAIYLDFAKAYDKVDHEILLQKVKNIGISGKIGGWIRTFLTERKQITVVEGASSKEAIVISGIPQGSVLGPILFIIMINDISTNLNSQLLSFADDTRILRPIKTPEDSQQLQEDLKKIYNWAERNNMMFNENKFELMKFGNNNNNRDTDYTGPNGIKIERKLQVRDLGVIISEDATFEDHLEKIVSKCKQLMGYILRTFKARDPETLLTLWKAIIIPHMDYCSQLWAPHKQNHVGKLEGLQRTFTSRIRNHTNQEANNLDYWQRLKIYQLYSIERRIERYIIIYTWKSLENKITPPKTEPIQPSEQQERRTGRKCIQSHTSSECPTKIKTLQHNNLSKKGARLFNCLPKYIRNITGTSTEAFKKELDKFLATIPDQPGVPGYTASRPATSNSIAAQLEYVQRSEGWRRRRGPASGIVEDIEGAALP